MRIARTALNLARIVGWGAGIKFAHHALKLAIAAFLDEISAYLQLVRARLLGKVSKS